MDLRFQRNCTCSGQPQNVSPRFSDTRILWKNLAQYLIHKNKVWKVFWMNESLHDKCRNARSFNSLSTQLLALPYFTNVMPGDWWLHLNFNYYHSPSIRSFLPNVSSYRQATWYSSIIALTQSYFTFLQIGSVTEHHCWKINLDCSSEAASLYWVGIWR